MRPAVKRTLMVVAAIPLVAVIAVIVLPRPYADSTTSAKMSEVSLSLSAVRTMVTEFYEEKKRLPRDETELALGGMSSNYVRQLTYNPQTQEWRAVVQNIPRVEGGALIYKFEAADGQLKWRCYAAQIEDRFLPEWCRSTQK